MKVKTVAKRALGPYGRRYHGGGSRRFRRRRRRVAGELAPRDGFFAAVPPGFCGRRPPPKLIGRRHDGGAGATSRTGGATADGDRERSDVESTPDRAGTDAESTPGPSRHRRPTRDGRGDSLSGSKRDAPGASGARILPGFQAVDSYVYLRHGRLYAENEPHTSRIVTSVTKAII